MKKQPTIDIIKAKGTGGGSENWKLSPLDIFCLNKPLSATWVFDTELNADELKSSLSEVLIYYPILSGRFNSSKWIDINNEGVRFSVEYNKDVNVKKFFDDKTEDSVFLDQRNKNLRGKGLEPIMTVKLTELVDGCVLTVDVSHGCLDGSSFFTMMQNWSRIHIGEPIKPPCINQGLLPDYCCENRSSVKQVVADEKWVTLSLRKIFRVFWGSMNKKPYQIMQPITISKAELVNMKRSVEDSIDCDYVTSNEVLSAFIGDMCTRLLTFNIKECKRKASKKGKVTLVGPIDCRNRIANMPADFVGNCIAVFELASIGTDDSLARIASNIHHNVSEKMALNGEYLARRFKLLLQVMHHKILAMPYDFSREYLTPSKIVSLNNFSKFPVYDINMGSKESPVKPVLVIPHKTEDMVLVWPAPPNEAGVYLYFTGTIAEHLTSKISMDSEWWSTFRRFVPQADMATRLSKTIVE